MSLTLAVYERIQRLPIRDARTRSVELPTNGIYVFFEAGESCQLGEQIVPRIVRIGTHREDGRLPGRIRNHYGSFRRLSGNKNSSVFRRHLGGALIRQRDSSDVRLSEWAKQGGQSEAEIEVWVSQYLREQLTYVCIAVEGRQERLSLERGLIALVAQHPLCAPSSHWLGHHAVSADIRSSGLWNTQHLADVPLTADEFTRLNQWIDLSLIKAAPNVPAMFPVPAGTTDRSSPKNLTATTRQDDGLRRTLVIVPCGSSKVWDSQPDAGPTMSKDAYTGGPFKVNRAYAERFGDEWVVLSAKYGFIRPNESIPGPYNVTFKRRATHPVGIEQLREQVSALGLDRFDEIVGLGGKEYRAAIDAAFSGSNVTLRYPFAGLPIGKMLQATRKALDESQPNGG